MPRHGIGIDISTLAGSEGVVTTIDDFVFESFSAGQMHPIQTVDRVNLVLQSETWNHNSWTKNASTVEANQIASPLNLSAFTADLLKEDNANAEHWVRSSNITASLGQTFTMSFYAKAKERTFIKANFLNSGVVSYNVWINLSNGAITSKNDNLTVTTELIGSGFYRITLTAQAAATTLNLLVALATGDANDSYAGDGSSGAYVFGAQVEQDNFVGNYIPTVGSTVTVSTTLNDTSEVWDFDGTDIMIAEDPEDEGFWEESYPEGATLPELVLNGDYEELGSELVTDGNFPTGTTAWTVGSGWNIANGIATASPAGDYLSQASVYDHTTVETYKITYDITVDSGTFRFLILGKTGSGVFGDQTTSGTYTVYFTTTGSSGDGRLFIAHQGGFDGDVNSVSVKQVDPNDRWTLGTGWSIEDGKAVHEGGSSNTYLEQQNITTIGSVYEAVFTLSGSLNATNYIQVYGASSYTISPNKYTSAGTYTLYFTADATYFRFRAVSPDNDISIDNVTVREYAIQPLDI